MPDRAWAGRVRAWRHGSAVTASIPIGRMAYASPSSSSRLERSRRGRGPGTGPGSKPTANKPLSLVTMACSPALSPRRVPNGFSIGSGDGSCGHNSRYVPRRQYPTILSRRCLDLYIDMVSRLRSRVDGDYDLAR